MVSSQNVRESFFCTVYSYKKTEDLFESVLSDTHPSRRSETEKPELLRNPETDKLVIFATTTQESDSVIPLDWIFMYNMFSNEGIKGIT